MIGINSDLDWLCDRDLDIKILYNNSEVLADPCKSSIFFIRAIFTGLEN